MKQKKPVPPAPEQSDTELEAELSEEVYAYAELYHEARLAGNSERAWFLYGVSLRAKNELRELRYRLLHAVSG